MDFCSYEILFFLPFYQFSLLYRFLLLWATYADFIEFLFFWLYESPDFFFCVLVLYGDTNLWSIRMLEMALIKFFLYEKNWKMQDCLEPLPPLASLYGANVATNTFFRFYVFTQCTVTVKKGKKGSFRSKFDSFWAHFSFILLSR